MVLGNDDNLKLIYFKLIKSGPQGREIADPGIAAKSQAWRMFRTRSRYSITDTTSEEARAAAVEVPIN